MDDLDLATVAARLGKSRSWLQNHHYVGRSPRWDEEEYQALRAAIIVKQSLALGGAPPLVPKVNAKQNGSADWPSSSETVTGMSSVPYGSKDAASASARVQAFPLKPKTRKRPRSFA